MLKKCCSNGCLPVRAIVGIMIFMTCFFCYMLRVNMSITIIAMVEAKSDGKHSQNVPECLITNDNNKTEDNSDATKVVNLPDYGVRYNWNSKTQGLILGSYFWGYVLMSLPGGYFAERYGPTKTVGITGIVSAVLTIITPLVASWHYGILLALRFVLGLMGGIVFPALHCLVSRWAPPDEKGKFTGALFGGILGTMVTWPLSGYIIEVWGWRWTFMVHGCLTLIWCALWMILVTDTPESHSYISEDETNYIAKSLGGNINKTKAVAPYFKIGTSIPFWALVVCHFGCAWGLYLLLTAGPKFMSEALGFTLGHTGVLASLPYLARLIGGFLFGYIGDVIRRKNWASVTVTRKSFVTLSHFLPGLLLLAIIWVGCNTTLCIALLTLSMGFNGASTVTNLQNNQDLSPNFAGTIYGLVNGIGATTGFFNPLLTGYITSENSGLNEWHKIFIIGAAIYIATGVIYCVFGSGEEQPWNQITAKSDSAAGVENPAYDNSDRTSSDTKV